MERYEFKNSIPRDDVALGILVAENVSLTHPHPLLEERLQKILEARVGEKLSDKEEKLRRGSRDILRNGDYKPTGRSKPASEYLIREAGEKQFPRINAVVDVNNYISLKYMVPISLWDTDLAKTHSFVFRLGKPGESYVFNTGGQTIDMKDLICGCAAAQESERPIITPIKDSLETKTTDKSTNIALAIYYPLKMGSQEHLNEILNETEELMKESAPSRIFKGYIPPAGVGSILLFPM